MKRILLASASIVAFAGAAAAEVTFSGDATLGYNDTDNALVGDDNIGFYWDASVDVTLSQALDNGLTATATFGLNVADNNLGESTESSDYVLSLTSDTAGLYFGNTEFAAVTHWTGAGEMDNDGFSEEDGETVLRGDLTYGGVNASVSYAVDTDQVGSDTSDQLQQLSFGVDGTFGTFSFAFAYQEEALPEYADAGGDFNGNEIIGVSVNTSVAGADIRVAYASDETAGENSIGLSATYPFGPVTIGAYYVLESADDTDAYGVTAEYVSGPLAISASYEIDQEDDGTSNQTEDWELTGSYEVGNGITAYAGVVDAGDDYYVSALMTLGDGASLLVSYVTTGDTENGDDETGPNDYQTGATVELGFSF